MKARQSLAALLGAALLASTANAQFSAFTARWQGTGNTEDDYGRVLCVDGRGNSYIVGKTEKNGNNSTHRIGVVSYDLFGTKRWEQTFGGTTDDCTGVAIVTDDLYV